MHIAVIGAGAAGCFAAIGIKRRLPEADVTIYEGGKRQGYDPNNAAYRGKEIYDPASNGWYWLDNVQQGAKAVSKDVYQESSGGKWVRYDANGQMIKGWNTNADGTYYFDPITGAMAKGTTTIDGMTYYFDPATGVKR